MDEIKRLYVGKIVELENTILDMTNGAVLKTILVNNHGDVETELILNIDGAEFSFLVATKETLIIDKSIVCNILKVKSSTSDELSIHISGIQLGGA